MGIGGIGGGGITIGRPGGSIGGGGGKDEGGKDEGGKPGGGSNGGGAEILWGGGGCNVNYANQLFPIIKKKNMYLLL